MTEQSQHSSPASPASLDEGFAEVTDYPANIARNRLASRFVNIDRRSQSNSILLVDEVNLSSTMPRPSHWSIAWSDLMMTMFVLFLVMFVYQSAHEDFLAKKKPEIVGGDTTDALQSLDGGFVSPIVPIRPLPLMTAGQIKKVVPVAGRGTEDPVEQPAPPAPGGPPAQQRHAPPDNAAVTPGEPRDTPSGPGAAPVPAPAENVADAPPRPSGVQSPPGPDSFQEMYTLGKDALENNGLDRFAAIDIVPDKTMRIILTGDLLFGLGDSSLTDGARKSLLKIASVIRDTPYMINVVGHTDNTPMHSSRFGSNWELSVARASTVARYLIDEIGMDPSQFVVSGYSSYRPVQPNTTAENRAMNRRVEIIISRRLPPPLPATTNDLN